MRLLQGPVARAVVGAAVALALTAGRARSEPLHERRVALVVGNSAYPTARLKNPANDARGVAEALRAIDFDVTLVLDADLKTLTKAAKKFLSSLGPGDVSLFYYSGHSIQVDGENYLEPIDFDADDLIEAKFQSYSAQLIQERMEASGAKLRILILDSCRDNPFRGLRSSSRGLAAMIPGRGTFFAFSTEPGGTASDNAKESNGLFTKYLLLALQHQELTLDEVFREVRAGVYRASEGRQLPWINSNVIGDFYFVPPGARSKAEEPRALATTIPPVQPSGPTELNNRGSSATSSPAEEANSRLAKAKEDALTALDKQVMPVINATGDANRLTLVFRKSESGLIYADDRFDITQPIIDLLDAGSTRGARLTFPATSKVAVVDIQITSARSTVIRKALSAIGKKPADWTQLSAHERESIETLLESAVRSIGIANRLTYVFRKFDSGLIFADDAIDITDAVVKQLDTGKTDLVELPEGAFATGTVDSERVVTDSQAGRAAIQKLKQMAEELSAGLKH